MNFQKVVYIGEDFHMGLRYRKSYDLIVDGNEYCIYTEDDKRLSNLPKSWFVKEEKFKEEIIKIRFTQK